MTRHVCNNPMVSDADQSMTVMDWLGSIVHEHLQHSQEMAYVQNQITDSVAEKIAEGIGSKDVANHIDYEDVASHLDISVRDVSDEMYDGVLNDLETSDELMNSLVGKACEQMNERLTRIVLDSMAVMLPELVNSCYRTQQKKRQASRWHRRLISKTASFLNLLRKQGGK